MPLHCTTSDRLVVFPENRYSFEVSCLCYNQTYYTSSISSKHIQCYGKEEDDYDPVLFNSHNKREAKSKYVNADKSKLLNNTKMKVRKVEQIKT